MSTWTAVTCVDIVQVRGGRETFTTVSMCIPFLYLLCSYLFVHVYVPWCPMVSHGVPWCPMVSHGVSWCPMVSHGVKVILIIFAMNNFQTHNKTDKKKANLR